VHVSKADERTLHHLVHEATRTIELDDLRRQSLPNPEVHGLERDDITEIEETGGLAAHSPFARGRGCLEMCLHIAREVEAQFNGSGDARCDDDRGHSAPMPTQNTPGFR
jgi:hypothetical protein